MHRREGAPLVARGPALALASAVLFGASTPLAKLLLGSGVTPWLLAGLLYAGSGVGLGALSIVRRGLGRASAEAALTRADAPWLALAILAGGVCSPILLMSGLARTSASTAALLLNLEGLGTMAIAWLVFRENVDRRIFTGAMAILTGAVVLWWQPGAGGWSWGSILIVGACLGWAIDNNLTRKVSGADPIQLSMLKGVIAGAVNLTLALLGRASLPRASQLLPAAAIGFAGYGVSLVLFVLALRAIGAARTSAYFSTAPFIGSLIAILVLHDPVNLRLALAGAFMAIGVWLHVREVHDHEHTHEEMFHSHRHLHDEHHQHRHDPSDPPGEPHAHSHRHERLTHRHPHFPDLHHTHHD